MGGMLAARTKKRCTPDRLSLPQWYMRQRWYDPQLQRFISRDPIGLSGGTNLYVYAANSPVVNIDAEGTDWHFEMTGGRVRDFAGTDGQAVWDFLQSNHDVITEIEIRGHSFPTCCGADGEEDRWASGLEWVGDDIIFYSRDDNGKRTINGKRYRDRVLKLTFRRLRLIRLMGCNTAGGHPDHKKLELKYKNDPLWSDHWSWPPNNDNIARKLSRMYPNVDVEGSKGPQSGPEFQNGWIYNSNSKQPRYDPASIGYPAPSKGSKK